MDSGEGCSRRKRCMSCDGAYVALWSMLALGVLWFKGKEEISSVSDQTFKLWCSRMTWVTNGILFPRQGNRGDGRWFWVLTPHRNSWTKFTYTQYPRPNPSNSWLNRDVQLLRAHFTGISDLLGRTRPLRQHHLLMCRHR